MSDEIRALLDEYFDGDPFGGDYGPRFQRREMAPEACRALRDLLDYADGLGSPFRDGIRECIAAALRPATPAAPRQPKCSCDSPGGEIPHRPECELNHPHHPCDDRSCSFAPRVWRVTASPDGTSAFVGFLYRRNGDRWEVRAHQEPWGRSTYTGLDDMRRAGFTLAEVCPPQTSTSPSATTLEAKP